MRRGGLGGKDDDRSGVALTLHALPHGEQPGGLVEVGPAQSEQFASAQPDADRELEQGVQRMPGSGTQDAAGLVGGQRRERRTARHGQPHRGHDVAGQLLADYFYHSGLMAEFLAAEAGGSALRMPGRPGPGVRAPCRNSFEAGTLVLMADGTTKPIEDVAAGDSVLAADQATGVAAPREVTDTIVGTGPKLLVQVSVAARATTVPLAGPYPPHESVGTMVVATGDHQFWTPDQGVWTTAAELRPAIYSSLPTARQPWSSAPKPTKR